ncbi:hypothetical protein WG70_07155 [Burkholderia oklahomensis EO147]|nr:hypothetical protein WG70_07155 [Burkholderia oklahomensis EO147]AOI49099.1 hypothetical protein WI23_25215 [Burkholderia oklahomensis C6786]KUY53671.1 hypothetical protein WG70_13395 [Burkholderia oklahomensis EO147]KUY60851.1 hypothetical protein WI23_14280 [Burkholderia oklahomensis C6786]
MRVRFNWLVAAFVRMAAGAVRAQELTGSLKKIEGTAVVGFGIRESSVPFSYFDNQQQTSAIRATSRRRSSTRSSGN